MPNQIQLKDVSFFGSDYEKGFTFLKKVSPFRKGETFKNILSVVKKQIP